MNHASLMLGLAITFASLNCHCIENVRAEEKPAPAYSANPKLQAQPENTWAKIGPAPQPKGILAYSGGAFDPVHGKFLLFGGGHADYWGNEVLAFDTATLAWKKMYEPDAESRYTNDNIDNTHGKLKDSDKPYTRHTYNQICYAGKHGSLFIFGGCGPGWGKISPTCPVPLDSWTYSLGDNKWTQRYFKKEPKDISPPGGYAMACCYDSKRDAIWAYGRDNRLSRFDLKTNTWTNHPLKPSIESIGHYNFQMEYIPSLDSVMIIDQRQALVNVETFAAEVLGEAKISGKGGLTYVPELNALLSVKTPGGEAGPEGKLAAFDCGTKKWIELTPAEPTSSRGDVWDRFHYDPVNKVAIMVKGDGVWAYKPPKSLAK